MPEAASLVAETRRRVAGWLRGRRPAVQAVPLRETLPPASIHRWREGYTVQTPHAPSVPMWKAASALRAPTVRIPPLEGAVVRDGLYCPTNSALLTPDRRVVAESVGTRHPQYPFRPEALQCTAVERLAGMATPLRAFRWNYYHMLVDCLPRLALAREHPEVGRGEVIQLLYAGAEPAPAERRVVQALGLGETRFVRVEEGRLYEVERYLLLPFLSRQFAGVLPAWYRQRLRPVLPPRPPRRRHRILVSRAGASKRRVRNEADVLAALAPLGFEAVALETLTFDEQVALFYDADVVVAPHGAGLTNLLFAPAARVVELFPTPFVVPHFYYLCSALGVPYRYWCGDRTHRDDDFEVEVAAMRTLVEEAL